MNASLRSIIAFVFFQRIIFFSQHIISLEEEHIIIKDIRNLFRLEKEIKVIKDIIIRDIKNLFEHEEEEKNYYKPVVIK